MRTTRRNLLKGGGKAVAAATVLSVTTGVAGAAPTDDAALMQDVTGWHELQKKISASLAEREKREKCLPERFRSSGVDPRGWQEYSEEFPASANNRLREYEPFYVRAGLGEIEDQLEGLWDDQDPITNRLMDAKPVTLAGAIALASVCISYVGSDGDPEDDYLVKVTDVGKRALADAERLAGHGRAI